MSFFASGKSKINLA